LRLVAEPVRPEPGHMLPVPDIAETGRVEEIDRVVVVS
jgi:hypothetical protein